MTNASSTGARPDFIVQSRPATECFGARAKLSSISSALAHEFESSLRWVRLADTIRLPASVRNEVFTPVQDPERRPVSGTYYPAEHTPEATKKQANRQMLWLILPRNFLPPNRVQLLRMQSDNRAKVRT
jgi:hypothetical protein